MVIARSIVAFKWSTDLLITQTVKRPKQIHTTGGSLGNGPILIPRSVPATRMLAIWSTRQYRQRHFLINWQVTGFRCTSFEVPFVRRGFGELYLDQVFVLGLANANAFVNIDRVEIHPTSWLRHDYHRAQWMTDRVYFSFCASWKVHTQEIPQDSSRLLSTRSGRDTSSQVVDLKLVLILLTHAFIYQVYAI